MIRFICAITIAFFMLSCTQNQSASTTSSDSTKGSMADSVTYPYKATYSASFDIGKSASAKTVLDIWKAYENNKLGDSKNLWADSATLQFENFTFRGSRDSLIAGGNRDRGQYTSLVDSVDAWVPLYSKDRKEEWVAVWAREYTTDKKGKKDTADIHEIWLIKDGKAAFMSQYRAHRRP